MKREKFIEVYSSAMKLGPKHMHFVIISEDTHEAYWPVMGKFNIRDMIENGAEPKKYKGYYYIEMNWLIYHWYKTDDFMRRVLEWYLRLLHNNKETILKKEKIYSFELVDKEMQLVEYVEKKSEKKVPFYSKENLNKLKEQSEAEQRRRENMSYEEFKEEIITKANEFIKGIEEKQKKEKNDKATK